MHEFEENGVNYSEHGLLILNVTPFYDYGVRNHQVRTGMNIRMRAHTHLRQFIRLMEREIQINSFRIDAEK